MNNINNSKIILDIIPDIPRLVPYSYNKKYWNMMIEIDY